VAFSVANREYDDEDEGDNDAEDNELDLHVLEPHLTPYPRALLPEIGSLFMQLLCPGDETVDVFSAINNLTATFCLRDYPSILGTSLFWKSGE
jgi:hypothetical protein